MEKLKCNACAYEWMPRTKEPKECPACKNRNWNKEPRENSYN